jgi:CrcB protein
MPAWVAVAVGGALGSVARFGVGRLVERQWPLATMPWATTVVNITGCLMIGLLTGAMSSGGLALRTPWREFALVGVLGGFTTFSAFGMETVSLARNGTPLHAAWNVALQIVLGLAAVLLGMWLGERAGS